MKRVFKICITICLLSVFVYYFYANSSELAALKELDFVTIFIYSLLLLATFILNAYFLMEVLKSMGARLKFGQAFNVFAIKRFSNYFLPRSGIVTSSVYLKKMHNLSYGRSFAYAVYISVIQMSVWSLLGFVSTFFNVGINRLLFVFIALTFASLVMIFYPRIFLLLPFAVIRKKVEAWIRFFYKKKLLIVSILIWLVIALLVNLRIFFLFQELNYHITFSKTVIINSLGMLSALLSITPAALGIKEAAMGLAAGIVEESTIGVLMIAGLDRVLTFFWLAIFWIWAFKKIKNQNNDKQT